MIEQQSDSTNIPHVFYWPGFGILRLAPAHHYGHSALGVPSTWNGTVRNIIALVSCFVVVPITRHHELVHSLTLFSTLPLTRVSKRHLLWRNEWSCGRIDGTGTPAQTQTVDLHFPELKEEVCRGETCVCMCISCLVTSPYLHFDFIDLQRPESISGHFILLIFI